MGGRGVGESVWGQDVRGCVFEESQCLRPCSRVWLYLEPWVGIGVFLKDHKISPCNVFRVYLQWPNLEMRRVDTKPPESRPAVAQTGLGYDMFLPLPP